MIRQDNKRPRITTHRIFDTLLRMFGALTLCFLVFVATLMCVIRIEYAIANPTLWSGIVTAKSYDDGGDWYSEYVIGRYSLRERHGDGMEHFHIKVTDEHGRTDWWEVSEKLYDELEIGRSITRKDVEDNGETNQGG